MDKPVDGAEALAREVLARTCPGLCLNESEKQGVALAMLAHSAALVAKNEHLREDVADLEGQLEEARYEPWPKWADDMKKAIRAVSGYDGYDDATDGVDLPSELDELIAALTEQADRNRAETRAARDLDTAERGQEHYRQKMSEAHSREAILAAALQEAHDTLHECTAVLTANDCSKVAVVMTRARTALETRHG